MSAAFNSLMYGIQQGLGLWSQEISVEENAPLPPSLLRDEPLNDTMNFYCTVYNVSFLARYFLLYLIDNDSDEGDIADALQREVSQMNQQRSEKNFRFQAVDSRAKNVIFIRTKVSVSLIQNKHQ